MSPLRTRRKRRCDAAHHRAAWAAHCHSLRWGAEYDAATASRVEPRCHLTAHQPQNASSRAFSEEELRSGVAG